MATKTKELIDGKEISILTENSKLIEGVIHKVKENSIVICINADWSSREEFENGSYEIISVSEHDYDSYDYYLELLEKKKPRLQFRFTEDDLKYIHNKYATVNYDGKMIEGKIVSYTHTLRNPKTISILRSNGEVKEIKDFRIRSLEIEESGTQLQLNKRLTELAEETYQMLREVRRKKPCLKGFFKNPEDLMVNYLQGEIKEEDIHNDWLKDPSMKKTNHSIDGKFYEKVKEASKINDYYKQLKDIVEITLSKIEHEDWTRFNLTDKKGKKEARDFIVEFILNN